MKRLISKSASLILMPFSQKRLIRKAEWVDVDIADANLVQNVTNLMASGGQMQILYSGEWKNIYPYGWNSSKEGNVLIMCYKDTGEVRSYRLDRVEAVKMDSSIVGEGAEEDFMADETSDDSIFNDQNNDTEEFDLPPDLDTNEQQPVDNQSQPNLPFDDAIDVLDSDEVPQEIDEEQDVKQDEEQEEKEKVKN